MKIIVKYITNFSIQDGYEITVGKIMEMTVYNIRFIDKLCVIYIVKYVIKCVICYILFIFLTYRLLTQSDI